MADDFDVPAEYEAAWRLIQGLPRNAAVAFAARCARRVLPLIPTESTEYRDAKEAIENAEGGVQNSIDSFTRAAPALGIARDQGPPEPGHPHRLALGAAKALNAAIATQTAFARAKFAFDCFVRSQEAAVAFGPQQPNALDAHYAVRLAADRDLRVIAEAGVWDDDASMQLDALGPLWPDGPPRGWPQVVDVPTLKLKVDAPNPEVRVEDYPVSHFRLRVSIPNDLDEATEARVGDQIAKIGTALSRLHELHGGSGLEMIEGESFDLEREHARSQP